MNGDAVLVQSAVLAAVAIANRALYPSHHDHFVRPQRFAGGLPLDVANHQGDGAVRRVTATEVAPDIELLFELLRNDEISREEVARAVGGCRFQEFLPGVLVDPVHGVDNRRCSEVDRIGLAFQHPFHNETERVFVIAVHLVCHDFSFQECWQVDRELHLLLYEL